jgi:phosphoribosylformylglycinamidine cyclo-ligase
MTTPNGTRLDYRSAGVDIDAADDAKQSLGHVCAVHADGRCARRIRRIRRHVSRAEGVSRPVARLERGWRGTKIKLAIEVVVMTPIGHCLVNHCTNDILVQGAIPLFFSRLRGASELRAAGREGVVAGVAAGCRENGCALIGGETAENARRVHASGLRSRWIPLSASSRKMPC